MFGCLVLLTLAPAFASSQSQVTQIEWSRPINLSVGTPGRSFHPVVVADPFGYVHVFWEEVVDLGKGVQGSYLFYSGWDGQRWSPPVDILLSPGAYSIVSKPSAAVDPDSGMLHLVWAASNNIFYSRALVEEARSARGWSEPAAIVYGAVQNPYLIVYKGILHLVYLDTGDEPGIWYTASNDGGDRWYPPTRLSLETQTRKVLPTVSETVQMRADEKGRLHVVWVDRMDGGIYYARSTNGGRSWEQPVQLDDEGTWPSLGILGDQLHVLWSATHEGPSCARRERISPDGGASWGEMTRVLTPVEGCLGWMNVEQDSAGVLHLFTIGRDNHGVVRPYYSWWTGTKWAEPEQMGEAAVQDGSDWQERGPDRARSSLSQGNLLHVVWHSNDGEIWYARARTNAPEQPPMPLPTRPAIPPTIPMPTDTPIPTETVTPSALPSATAVRVLPQLSRPGDILRPVLVGSGLTGLLVLLTILIIRRQQTR